MSDFRCSLGGGLRRKSQGRLRSKNSCSSWAQERKLNAPYEARERANEMFRMR